VLGSITDEVERRLNALEIPFSRDGIDPYGLSRSHMRFVMNSLGVIYRYYFRTTAHGIGNIPKRGRAMLVCNHAGGIATDGAMIIAAAFFELDPPRLAQGMADKFIAQLPFGSHLSVRMGQLTGLPEHALRLLSDERLLMVFPEGVRGTAKLFSERHSLVEFGTGFMRLALQTRTPILPVAYLGGGEAVPTIMNLKRLGTLIGAPYLPVTPYLLPMPLPVHTSIHFGEPMLIDGDGTEEDATIIAKVLQVKEEIARLIDAGARTS
jgi:1-acyl-sn-glycerol-3-phosphate acyltransferase